MVASAESSFKSRVSPDSKEGVAMWHGATKEPPIRLVVTAAIMPLMGHVMSK
jgi:hypothetical protein